MVFFLRVPPYMCALSCWNSLNRCFLHYRERCARGERGAEQLSHSSGLELLSPQPASISQCLFEADFPSPPFSLSSASLPFWLGPARASPTALNAFVPWDLHRAADGLPAALDLVPIAAARALHDLHSNLGTRTTCGANAWASLSCEPAAVLPFTSLLGLV